VRGLTVCAALLDEQAFWPTDEAANPDYEVLKAIRPSMLTLMDRGAMLIGASSPYARRGELYAAYRRHWGKAGEKVLCWKAATLEMNPSVPVGEIEAERERDPANASSEYDAEFRSDISDFVRREIVEAAIERGTYERARERWVRYFGFVDPSGGSGDSFALAIGHRTAEGKRPVLDCLREWTPPFNPEQVTREVARTCQDYGVRELLGDAYAGMWPREAFAKWGLRYQVSPVPKNEIYLRFLPMLNSKGVDLLDNPKLVGQLCGLERRTARGGRDSIDHAPRGHDDLANACAGLMSVSLAQPAGVQRVPVLGI
jgi:hypothetical protein